MIYDAERGDISMALAGDVMVTRALSPFREKRFLALRQLICGADVAFANMEGPVRGDDEGGPGISHGTYMTMPPVAAAELRWLGVTLASCANNHVFDYGDGGLLATLRHLADNGIVPAGAGRTLAEARRPAYLDTARGRVGLVAATATYHPWTAAGEQRRDMAGRPGVNPIGHRVTYTVDDDTFAALQRAARGLGFAKAKERDRKHSRGAGPDATAAGGDSLTFLGKRFVRGPRFAVTTEADTVDVDDNLRAIAEARRTADWVIVSLHSHETGGKSALTAARRSDLVDPADFAATFARAAIDAGADMVVGHGSHVPLGIELYKGRPILHSVGNLVFQPETIAAFPAEAYERHHLGPLATPSDFHDARTDGGKRGQPASPEYWENILVRSTFRKGRLHELRIHPVDQGFGRPRAQRGRPVLAEGKVAARVLARMKRLCARYKVTVRIRDNIGIIRP